MQLRELLSQFASKSPTPGGGSAAALSGALGAGLISMVANLTIGKKGYEPVEDEMKQVLGRSESLRERLTSLIEEDSGAFDKVMAAFKLPKETEEEKGKRRETIQEATKGAALVPLEVMKCSKEALGLAKVVALKGNVNSISDCGVAALELRAAVKGGNLNCLINLSSIKDDEFKKGFGKEMAEAEGGVEELVGEIQKIVNEKIG